MRARLYGSAKGLSWFPARRIVPIADLLEEGSMGAVVSEATQREGRAKALLSFCLPLLHSGELVQQAPLRSQLDSAYTLLAGA